MCEKTDTTKEVIVVEEPVQVVPAIPAVPDISETSVKDFPLCLLEKKSYTGIKGLVGIFFWVSLIYFGYGIVHFFMWENTFWGIVWNIFSKPIYLIYHVSVFSFMYCFFSLLHKKTTAICDGLTDSDNCFYPGTFSSQASLTKTFSS